MTAYEELVERCCMLFRELESSAPNDEFTRLAYAKTLLTSVLRTLETVTPEMFVAGDDVAYQFGCSCGAEPPDPPLSGQWLAMLRASPLAPKTEGGGITIATLAMGDGSILRKPKKGGE